MNARELVLDIFLEMEKTGSYANSLIRDVLDKYDYEDAKEKAFFKRLAEGTLERRITLDWAINCYSRMPVEKMKPLIRNLLRISAYQILYMEGIPDAAACNEAVKLAKKRGFSSLSGFVNGVLRSLARNKNDIPMPDPDREPIKSLSVRFSLPEWMILLWTEQYGKERAEQVAAGIEQKRPVIIRFCSALSEEQKEGALEQLRRAGVSAEAHPLYENAYALENCEGVANLPGFAEGLFYVQDVSSMLAVEAAGIRPGMRVLDLCSAPGGKAILAYEKLKLPQDVSTAADSAVGETAAEGQQEPHSTAADSAVRENAATGRRQESPQRMAAEYGAVRENTQQNVDGLQGAGAIKAGDLTASKAEKIRENAARMGCRDMEISVWDAAEHMEELEGWADVVLADVPCSGLGVMGRKKDIRYRVQPQDLKALADLQKEILAASWEYVKPGGVLLYSTCTVDRMENEEMVQYITDNFPFERESLNEYLPGSLQDEQTADGMLQLFPGEHDTDGFFIARLRRKSG